MSASGRLHRTGVLLTDRTNDRWAERGFGGFMWFMRSPRRIAPNTFWFVTSRCARAQFRLRPDPLRVEAFGRALGRALEVHPGIRLMAAVQMSNHLHLVLEDGEGVLDRFMCQFLGPLAKAVNELDGTSGQVYARRYSAIEILDDAALLDRLTYTITNPVAAGLVERAEEWPGLLVGPGFVESMNFPRLGGGELPVAVAHPLPLPREWVRAAVREQEESLKKDRGGRPVLGRAKVLAQPVFGAPENPKRGPAPLCLAGCAKLREEFRARWRAFEDAYRWASAAFRSGVLDVSFPDWSFRPSLPLLTAKG